MSSLPPPFSPLRQVLRYGAPGILFAGAVTQAATTITMDAGGSGNVNSSANFGDNIPATPPNGNYTTFAGATGVVGTPDITLAFGGGDHWDLYNAWDGRGNVIQGEQYPTDPALTILFTPAAGWAAALQSADFDMWAGGGPMTVEWSVTGISSGTLASGTWNRTTGGRDTINFASTGAIGEVLTLTMNMTAGSGSYFAVDNLTFDQVPEPSAALLGGLALGAAALRRRRS
jgi:hypothetical protein